MPEVPRAAASIIRYHKIAYIVAAAGTVLAVLVCVFLGMGRTQYQSQAILSYAPDTLSGTEASMLSAETVAARALDDAHLAGVLDGLGLYPELRQGSSQTAALNFFRSNISIKQVYVSPQSEVDVHLTFRDPGPLKGPGVANALADVLAAYVPADASALHTDSLKDDGPGSAPPGVIPATSAPSAMLAQDAPASPLVKPPEVTVSGASPVGLTKDQLRRRMNWVDGQLADLQTEQSTLHAASVTVQGHINQIQAAGRDEATASRDSSRLINDPSAAKRAQLTQQLATEQQKLAALRERYTDAYPDVQTSQASVAQIQAKLAEFPPVPRPSAPATRTPDLYQNNMDQLTAEESQVGGKLRDIEHRIAGLEHYREETRLALQSAPENGSAPPQPAPRALQKLAAPVATSVQSKSSVHTVRGANIAHVPSAAAADLSSLKTRPFRIVSAATGSVPVQRLAPAVFMTVAGAWLLLLLLCFVPLLLMKNAVITDENDIRATLPRQIAYLGSVRRMEL